MSQTLNEAVKRVVYAANGAPDHEAAFDPTPYIPLATSLIDMLRECMAARRAKGGSTAEAAAQIKHEAANPPMRHRIFVHRRLKRELGPEEFRAHGGQYIEAIFKTASEASVPELVALSDETQHDL